MSTTYNVAVLIGSLRKKSFHRLLAQALVGLALPSLCLEIVEVGDLPFYNEDLEPETPATWQALRQRVQQADAVLLLTPEYNRSVPAVLKNAVDVLSRPYGKGALTGKPAAVISASPGAMGGFGANHHPRQSLVGVGAKAMASPEAYIGGVTSLFDEQGALVNEKTREFLQVFMKAFANWTAAVGRPAYV